MLAKSAPGERKTDEELDHAIRQIVSQAVVVRRGHRHLRRRRAEEAGHLDPVRRVPGRSRGMPQRNLAVELLRKLLKGEIKTRARSATSSRRARSPRCWSRRSARYQNRAIETAQVIEELIELAKEMREAARARRGARPDRRRGRVLRRARGQRQRREGAGRRRPCGRSRASWSRPSARNVTIDWTVRENVRAQLRVLVKRILRKYGYPPDKQEKATQTVLEQAEVLSAEWAQ